MQPAQQEPLSVTRRPLDVEDYIDVVRRHKSWIIAPAFFGLVLSVVTAFLWPNTYISQATVQVIPPQVPERFVQANLNSETSQRIQTMANEIESRPTLTNIINTYDLYKKQKETMPLDDIVEMMRKNISISQVQALALGGERKTVSAFRVAFKYSDRNKAQKVAQDLAGRFQVESIKQVTILSVATTEFLKDEWETAKRKMDDAEKKLTAFRTKNAGRLPEMQQTNVTNMNAIQTQLSSVNDQVFRAGQEKLMLESQLRIAREQLQRIQSGGDDLSTQMKSERLSQIEHDILTAEMNIAGLRQKYKEGYPDLRAAEAQLQMLKNRREQLLKEEEQKATEAPKKISPLGTKNAQQLEAVIQQMQSQLEAKDLEIAEKEKNRIAINKTLDELRGRVNAAPALEGEYNHLNQEYLIAKQSYEDLNNKERNSELATNLENRGQGEKLTILENATVPQTPADPNRWMIVGAGAGIGLMLGVFLAGAREIKDSSLKNLKDARAYTGLPVLGTIPLLENDLVVRRKRRLAWLAWSAASIVGIVAMSGAMYYYFAVVQKLQE